MPLIEVKLYDRRINDDVVPQVIEKMTDAICEVIGEEMREHTWVIVEGISPKQGGMGGKPTAVRSCTAAASSCALIRKSPSPATQTTTRSGWTTLAATAAGTP